MQLLTIYMMTAPAQDRTFSCLKHCRAIHVGFGYFSSCPSTINYPRSIKEDLNAHTPHTHFISLPLECLFISVKIHSRASTLFHTVLLDFLFGSSTIPPLSPFSSLLHICAFSCPPDAKHVFALGQLSPRKALLENCTRQAASSHLCLTLRDPSQSKPYLNIQSEIFHSLSYYITCLIFMVAFIQHLLVLHLKSNNVLARDQNRKPYSHIETSLPLLIIKRKLIPRNIGQKCSYCI